MLLDKLRLKIRYIINGIVFYIILYLYVNHISSIESFFIVFNKLMKEINLTKMFVYFVFLYVIGIFISFSAYIIFEIIVEIMLELFFKIFSFSSNIKNVLKKITDKLILEKFNFFSFYFLQDYKRLEYLLFITDKESFNNFIKEREILLIIRDLFLLILLISYLFFNNLIVFLFIFVILMILYFIVGMYECIVLKSYIEVVFFRKNKEERN